MLYLAILTTLTLAGAFGNRWRGGWNIETKTPHQVRRIVVCFVPTMALLLPHNVSWYVWPIAYLIIFYFFFVAGWGSWMFINARDGWAHNFDAFWVELLLLAFFGKKWIPANATEEQRKVIKGQINVVDSPTGQPRSLDWCKDYNYLGMCFRGAGMSIVSALILFFSVGFSVFYPLLIALGFLMGFCYEIWYEIDNKKLPSFLRNSNTHLGEFLTGGIVMGGGLYLLSSLAALGTF